MFLPAEPPADARSIDWPHGRLTHTVQAHADAAVVDLTRFPQPPADHPLSAAECQP